MVYLKLYYNLLKITIKSKMEYRLNFFFEIFASLFSFIFVYLGIWIIFTYFNHINGWSLYEIMLLCNYNYFAWGLACSVFFSPMSTLGSIVQKGEFDSYLIRPINTLLYIISRDCYLGFIGINLLGIVVFIICSSKLSIHWSLNLAISAITTIIGGALIYSAMFIFIGALSFKFIKTSAFTNFLIYDVRDYVNYPISILPRPIQLVLTMIIPYAFVNYYPSTYLLGKSHDMISGFGSIFVGVIFFILSYIVFNKCIKLYEGTGN